MHVLVQTSSRTIPLGLLCYRWTRDAQVRSDDGIPVANDGRCRVEDNASMHTLVRMCGESRQALEVGVDFISRAKEAINSMTIENLPSSNPEPLLPSGSGTKPTSIIVNTLNDDAVMNITAPPWVRSRGRPKQSRMKSAIESPGGKKRKVDGVPLRRSSRISVMDDASNIPQDSGNTDGQEENYEPSQTRKCHACGEYGHYRSTCGRKSAYSSKNR